MIDNRNSNIDVLKFISAVLVVFLHCHTSISIYYMPLTRCAVPIFFIISGFLMYNGDVDLKRLKKSIKHILYIILWSTSLFAIVKLIFYLKNLSDSGSFITARQLFEWIVFNENPFYYHLWYLSAYLYVLIIVYYAKKLNGLKLLMCFIPLLLLVDLIIGKYSLVLLGMEFPYIYARNFMFVGLPYFLIGMLLKININKLKNIRNISNICIIGIIFSIISTYIEFGLLELFSKNATRDHYISTTFLACFTSLAFFTYKNLNLPLIAKFGKLDSLYIYIYHPLFILVLGYFIKGLRVDYIVNVYNYLCPIVVLLSTILFINGFRKVKNLIRTKSNAQD